MSVSTFTNTLVKMKRLYLLTLAVNIHCELTRTNNEQLTLKKVNKYCNKCIAYC